MKIHQSRYAYIEWYVLIGVLLGLGLSSLIYYSNFYLFLTGVITSVSAILMFVSIEVLIRSTELSLGKNSLLIKEKFEYEEQTQIRYKDIEKVIVKQNLIHKILNVGTLILIGKEITSVTHLGRPKKLKEIIDRKIKLS